MSNQIRLKRGSGSDPSASDLVVGEVALRTDNGKLFTKKDDNSIAEIGTGITDGDKGDITVSSSGATFTIDNGVVSTGKIANSAITNAKLNDSAITTAKIANNAVTTAKILDGNVTSAKIADGTIVNADINASAAIARTKLANVDLVDDTSPQLGGTLDANGQVISFPDSNGSTNQARFGTGNDLKIYHQSNSSYILNSTGNLNIASNNEVRIKGGDDAAEHMGRFIDNGAVELYYDASKKLETKSDGVLASGSLTLTGQNTTHTAGGLALGYEGSHVHQIRTYGANTSNNGRLDLVSSRSDGTSSYTITLINHSGNLSIPDNQKLALGNGGDLEIYHDGSNSYIADVGTGELRLRGTTIRLTDHNGTENFANFVDNGAVELFYDNSKKFETTTNGGSLTGDWNVSNDFFWFDNGEAVFGSGGDLKIYHDGTDSRITNTTGALQITSNNDFRLKTNGGQNIFKATGNAVELYYDTGSGGSSKKLETASHGVSIGGNLDFPDNTSGNASLRFGNSQDFFMNHNGSDSYIINNTGDLYIRDLNGDVHIQGKDNEESIIAKADGAVELYYDNTLRFLTNSVGAQCQGDFSIPLDNEQLRIGASNDLRAYHDSSNSVISNATGEFRIVGDDVRLMKADQVEHYFVGFANNYSALYFDNSQKLKTLTNGVQITGQEFISEGTIYLEKSGAHHHRILANDTGNDLGFQQSSDTGANTNFTTYLRIKDGGDISLPVDSKKLLFGAGDDLEIYHDGSNSYIENSTGGLFIKNTDGSNLDIFSHGSARIRVNAGEMAVDCSHNSSVDLYFDNSKKLATASDGITVYGRIAADELDMGDDERVKLGNSDDLEIYHDGSNSYLSNSTGYLYVQSDSVSLAGKSAGENYLVANLNSSVQLYYDNSKVLETTASGVDVQGHITLAASNNAPKITFDENGADDPKAEIQMDQTDGSNASLIFKTEGGGTLSTRMTLASDGNVGIGKNSSSLDLDGSIFMTSGQNLQIVKSGSGGKIITLNRRTNVGLSMEFFRGSGSSVGSISHNNSSTAFNTTSDYRLKENVVTLSDAITRLKTLKPYRFNFIADKDVTVDGFLAHEVTAVPEAIQGEKDAVITQEMVDNEEYEKERLGEILPQGIDQSKLVPLLVAAVQEAIGKIEVLETEVAALKAG